MELTQALLEYAAGEYGTQPDRPFKRYPDYQILRHEHNRKWYGAIMLVEAEKLGLPGTEVLPILNVKVKPELAMILQARVGVLPAYHMNKENWLSLLLTGEIPITELTSLLDDSYLLTRD